MLQTRPLRRKLRANCRKTRLSNKSAETHAMRKRQSTPPPHKVIECPKRKAPKRADQKKKGRRRKTSANVSRETFVRHFTHKMKGPATHELKHPLNRDRATVFAKSFRSGSENRFAIAPRTVLQTIAMLFCKTVRSNLAQQLRRAIPKSSSRYRSAKQRTRSFCGIIPKSCSQNHSANRAQ